jgi:fucose permease
MGDLAFFFRGAYTSFIQHFVSAGKRMTYDVRSVAYWLVGIVVATLGIAGGAYCIWMAWQQSDWGYLSLSALFFSAAAVTIYGRWSNKRKIIS